MPTGGSPAPDAGAADASRSVDASPAREDASEVNDALPDSGEWFDSLAACSSIPRTLFGACVRDDVSGAALTARTALTGFVEGFAQPDDACFFGIGEASDPSAYALRVSDGTRALAVTLRLPWPTPIVSIGDTLSIDFVQRATGGLEDGPNADGGHLVLRDGDGKLLLWIGESTGGFTELELPPELMLDGAGDDCSVPEGTRGCGPGRGAGLSFLIGNERVELAYGETAELTDFTALHGDNRVLEQELGGCGVDSAETAHFVLAALVHESAVMRATDACSPETPCSGGLCTTWLIANGCDGVSADDCTYVWDCDGTRFEIACASVGDDLLCECRVDEQTVHTLSGEGADVPLLAERCGFPAPADSDH